MIKLFQELIANQYEAAFCTLGSCIDQCPDSQWNEPVANLKFCQAAFHALFFADVYLGPELKALRDQPFHKTYEAVFQDYEELEDRPRKAMYEKSFVNEYLAHCRTKTGIVVPAETTESLARRPGFDWLDISRAEVHVYNIRHIQHHAAQLSLRLRIDTGDGVDWVRSGWNSK